MRRWAAAGVLASGVALVALVSWSIVRFGRPAAGWMLLPGLTLVAVGTLHLLPDRRPLDATEVRVHEEPIVAPRPPRVTGADAPTIVMSGGRIWDEKQALGGSGVWARGRVLPTPSLRASDTLAFDVRAGVSDARVGRVVRAACRAATRALPHRGRVRAHAELAPDLGEVRVLKVKLELSAQILHEEDRDRCAAAFARIVRKKIS